MILIKAHTFTTSLIEHGSWGSREIGSHESTMSYYQDALTLRGYIEWDIPNIEQTEEIGLWYEWRDGKLALTDYDGLASLPKQAWELLESLGIIVDEEFKS